MVPRLKEYYENKIINELQKEFSLKKLESSSNQKEDSTSSQQQILKVKVQMMEDLLELTCLTKPSLKDSQ